MRLAVLGCFLWLCIPGDSSAQGMCSGAGCVCSSAGCSCPSQCALSCTGSDRCSFTSDGGGTVVCDGSSRCQLALGNDTSIACTTTDRCRGVLGARAQVQCSGPGECRLDLGADSVLDCQPATITGKCEPLCRGSCLLHCIPSAGGDCELTFPCADGGAPTACGGGYLACEGGCALVDAGVLVPAPDGGAVDAGGTFDAGFIDAGVPGADAGSVDAGALGADAGSVDAGTPAALETETGVAMRYGIGCNTSGALLPLSIVVLFLRRRLRQTNERWRG